MDILQEHGYQSIAGTLCRKYRIRDDEVKQLIQNRDIAGIHARSKRLKQRIIDSVTEGFPKCAMRDRVTSRLSCDGYYIENVIIQSLPDVWIPINVYVPAQGHGPFPTIVVPIGHWVNGKAIPENQILCANLALQGFVVATYDPICQGERRLWTDEQLRDSLGDIPEDLFAVAMHMVPGNLFYLLDKNLMSLFVHDGHLVIDYICSREDVDTERIGITGQSGGGTQTAFLAVADDRIKAYSPIQCLSKQALMIPVSGIGDCEQSLLRISSEEGFDYEDILWAALPKPVMVSSGSRDMFYIEGVRQFESELSQVYKLLGMKDDFSVCVADCTHHISAGTRLFAYRWFGKVFKNDDADVRERDIQIQTMADLACIPEGMLPGSPMVAAKELLIQEREKRVADPERIRAELRDLLRVKNRRTTVESIVNGNVLLHVQGARTISFSDSGETAKPLCLLISDDRDLARTLEKQYRVIQAMPWEMGTAYSKNRNGYDAETRLFNAAAVLGDSLMADRVNQALALAEYLCESNGLDRLRLAGKGAGALVALLAAVVGKRFIKTALVHCPRSLDALFEDEHYVLAETLILPGICRIADLEQLVSLEGDSMLMINPVDARGNAIGDEYCEDEAAAIVSFLN